MIDLQTPAVVYDALRPPFHDGMGEEHACATFQCTACSSTVERNVLSGIATGTPWFRSLPLADQEIITKAFSCTLEFTGVSALAYPRFPNGAAAHICTAECASCRSVHLLAIQFHEKQPARYIGVLQGVARLASSGSSMPAPLHDEA
jgi:hypothetical protein